VYRSAPKSRGAEQNWTAREHRGDSAGVGQQRRGHAASGPRIAGSPGTCRHGPKRELWLAWSTLVVFYNLFFDGLRSGASSAAAGTAWDLATQVHYFHDATSGYPWFRIHFRHHRHDRG